MSRAKPKARTARPAAKRIANGHDTAGAAALRAVPGSLAQLAAVVGCSRQTIANWRTGAKSPDEKWRARIKTAWAIPITAWDRAALAAVPDEAAPTPPPAPTNGHGRLDTMVCALELLEGLRAQRQQAELAPSIRAKLTTAEVAALAQVTRLEDRQFLLEDRIVREHPSWQKIKRRIVAVLVKHPAAMHEIAAALADVDAPPT